jgi:hypothetical protein
MKKFSELSGKYNGRTFVVIGAGKTLSIYKDKIEKFIKKNDAITIGVNNMTHVIPPEIHVWGNNQRLRDFGGCIKKGSTLIIGRRIKQEHLNKWNIKDYYLLDYTEDFNKQTEKMSYVNGVVHGFYRTMGNMSIFLSYIMGASKIYVVGMDGYTLVHSGDQHCYGKGLTDLGDMKKNNSMADEKEKDDLIYNVLRNIRKLNFEFKIITPTIYEEFYDGSVL